MMSNVFEFKLQTADLKTVDAKDLSESLADLKLQIEKKFAEVKTKVSNTDLEQEAENFFKSLPLYVDGPNLRVQVGETYIKAKDNTEYKSIVDTINESIAKANAEMVAITQKFKKDKQNVQDETTEAMKQVTYPEFDDLTLLQAAYAGHPEYATKPARTREEKRLSRLTDRYEDANSDKARRRISKKIEKTADKIADRRADTARNMADAAADYTFAEELQNQAWYYNDILNALTKDPRSSRVHYLGESILIDTYHPLFRNTVNLKGTIRLTGMMVEQYKIKEQLEKGDRKLTVEEQRWIAEHPEDREVINKGGIIGGLVDGLVEHSNFPPESAKGLKSAAKIGALIGLGILGWHTIKKVFNIAGKNKKGEGIAWGLGAAGILIGIPALTGQRLDQLLFSGDPKQAIENLKNLGEKLGIDTKNMFASTNETVIWPAMGNLMYGDMTLEDAAKYIEYKDSKYTLKTNDYVIYLKQQRDAVTDEPAKQRYTDKLSLIQKAIDEKKINDITNSWCKTVNLDGAADKKILGETAYRAYLDGLTLGASLLETDKKLKISDKAKFDAYIREQIIDKKRNPSTITKDELKTAGLLIEVKTSSTNNADNNNSNNNTDNADNSDNSNNSNEKNNWEEFKEWTKPKREAFKKQCAKAKDNASVFMASLFSGEIFRGAESDVLKARRAELANLKKTLADLKKQSNIADKSVGNAAEIGLVETELKDADEMLAKIAVLSEEKVDKDLASVNIPDSEKENLTNAKKKINFDLKFQSEGDNIDLIVENGKLYVQSCGEKTHISFNNGKYYLDNLTIPFNNADNILRIANITNFIKINFQNRASANVSSPWKYDDGDLQFEKNTAWDALKKGDVIGMVFDTTVLDGEDFIMSTAKKAGGTAFQSRLGDYVNYLNAQRNSAMQNLWVKKDVQEQLPGDLEYQKKLFENNIAYAHAAKVFDRSLGTYYGGQQHTRIERASGSSPDKEYYDKTAAIEVHGNIIYLRSYDRLIPIYPSKTAKDKWNIGAPGLAKEGDTMKMKPLEIDFNVQDAIRVGNLTNYLIKNFRGMGADSDPFETEGANLDFDDKAFTDARIIHKGHAEEYSKEFNTEAGLDIYKNWLHDIAEWKSD